MMNRALLARRQKTPAFRFAQQKAKVLLLATEKQGLRTPSGVFW